MKRKNYFIASLVSFLVISCEPLVTTFNDTEDAILYQANLINEYPAKKSVKVMTWNIRFGIARLDFFGMLAATRPYLVKVKLWWVLKE